VSPGYSSCPEPHRVVHLVYNSLGIILNGGFEALFSSDFIGDPGYVFSAAAYRKIGCTPAADAFAEALALFPTTILNRHPKQRHKFYMTIDERRRDAVNDQLWKAQDGITSALAAYIRANKEHFLTLEPIR
jgi:hypothetical protein